MRPINSGISPYFRRSAAEDCERLGGPALLLALDVGPETHDILADPLINDRVKTHECAAAYKENVFRVHLNKLLVGMFAAALRRHTCNRSLDELEQRLLHSLTDTSRVMEGLSDWRLILSISSNVDIPRWARSTS